MAIHCNECGAGNPETSDFCARCGAALTGAKDPDLSSGLVLPDWLTQAAAETPARTPAAAAARTEPGARAEASNPPSPSIPSGDLSSTIPSWLKGPLRPIDAEPEEQSLLIDPTDTRGFITENDLPAWIREIADKDAANKAEAERKESIAASGAIEPEPEAPAAPRRRLLPGEVDPALPSVNAWLSRVERPVIETPLAEPIASVPAAAVPEPEAIGQDRAVSEASSIPAVPRKRPALTLPSREHVTARHLLVSAIVLLLIVVLLVALL